MRFPSEIVRRVREICGEDFIIGFKYNGYENLPGGVDLPLACRIGHHMEGVGVDYLHVASLDGPTQMGEEPRYQAVVSLYSLERNPLGVWRPKWSLWPWARRWSNPARLAPKRRCWWETWSPPSVSSHAGNSIESS